MEQEKNVANNTENIRKYGRRASDNTAHEEDMSHKDGSLFRWLINGVTVGGVIGAIFFSGRASSTMDTALKVNDNQDTRIEQLFEQNNKLLLALTEQNIQQKESDKRFEKKFDDANEKLNDIKQGQDKMNDNILRNEKDIIILQQKISSIDKLSIYSIAMR